MWEGAIMAAICAATKLRDSVRKKVADALIKLQRVFEGARRGCWVVRVIRGCNSVRRFRALSNLISWEALKVTLE